MVDDKPCPIKSEMAQRVEKVDGRELARTVRILRHVLQPNYYARAEKKILHDRRELQTSGFGLPAGTPLLGIRR